MSRSKKKVPLDTAREDIEVLAERLGAPVDPALLALALTHRSWAHESGGLPTNERLEFLGDAVLGVIVTERLYRDNPNVPEGELAKMRAATVSQRALATVGRDLDLGPFIKLGRGETTTGGRNKDSILSDTVEAVIGATYLTVGLEPTREVVERLVAALLRDAQRRGEGLDWKTTLQELAAAQGHPMPVYEVTGEGPDHARTFHAVALVGGSPMGNGVGSSKKTAEQVAAEAAVTAIHAASGASGGTSGAANSAGPAGG